MGLLPRLYHNTSGASLVELLLAIGIAGAVLPAIFVGFITTRQGRAQQIERAGAVSLLREATEAVRSVRERGWTSFATNGTYYPVTNSGVWSLTAGIQTLGEYTRSIVISNIARNSSGQIVSSGGTPDPSTKKIVTTISWTSPYASSVSSTLYVTRYLDNALHTETTQADFAAGISSGTTVTNTSGGEVTLGAGGSGDWCAPNLSITAVDLPKSGVANAISAIQGQIVAGTGDNASGVSFAKVTVSNTNPPTSSVTGTFDGYKTNAVFTEANYAYLGTDTNSKEVVILDLTTLVSGKYQEVGSFNAPGAGSGVSVTTSGNIGFMISGSTLYTFDLSSKVGSRAQLGSLSLAGTGKKIMIVGSEAYIATTSTTKQLQVVHFDSSGTTLTDYGYATLNGSGATDVVVNSSATRAYVATSSNASKPEFFIVNVSSKSSSNPSLSTVGSYDTAGMDPVGVTIVPGNKAIIVGHSGQEYQVITIINEASPASCGGLNIDSGINGVASVIESDNDTYSYIITGDSSSELKIIQGGPGEQFGVGGSFTSAIFAPGYKTAFNRFTATTTLPYLTDISFQIGIADSDTCASASYTYVGPDGTSGTSFTSSGGTIPLDSDGSGYENPGKCFRYKATFTSSDLYSSPILSDITINYSP